MADLRELNLETIEIEARLQQLIDSWGDDAKPTREKLRKHHERSAREKIDRWLEQRQLRVDVDYEFLSDTSQRKRQGSRRPHH